MSSRWGESVTFGFNGADLSITRWDDNTVSIQVLRTHARVEVEAKATRSEIAEIAALFSKPRIEKEESF